MKVLIVTDTYPPHVNGAAYFTYRLAQRLTEHSHQVQVIAPSRSGRQEKYLQDKVTTLGIRSVPLYINNMRIAVPRLNQRTIASAIKQFQPDIIHAQGHFWLSQAVVRQARKLRIPIVGTNHFMPDNLTHYLRLPPAVEARLNAKLWQQCINYFASLDAVTTPTRTAANLLIEHGFTKPVQVISNGIDLKKFNPHYDTPAVRKKYRLPNLPTIITVGRLDKEKNIDTILHTVAQVLQTRPIHLVVVGSKNGSAAHHLRHLTRRLKIDQAVTFTGFVPAPDLPALYCSAQIFTTASTAELQSIATMEAMACGLPVVAANSVALPELVAADENGLLFSAHDHEQFARHLLRLLADQPLLRRMGQASLARIQNHAIDTVIQQFIDLYTDLSKKPA